MLVQPLMAPCDYCLLHRVKSFTFKEREVTVEIPKPLLLADIIVRLQMTKNDVYTPLSHTGKSSSRPPSKTTAEPEGVGEELATAAEDEKVVCVCLSVCLSVSCAPGAVVVDISTCGRGVSIRVTQSSNSLLRC